MWRTCLHDLASNHQAASHEFFAYLKKKPLATESAIRLLRSYDVHASALRRLLLKAATLMPEPAVGYVLENVRNEYGNGNYQLCHQNQLHDLAKQTGIAYDVFLQTEPTSPIWSYIREVNRYYFPVEEHFDKPYLRPAVAAGAITATEILALAEFKALQEAFAHLSLDKHIWFHHVEIEAAHSDDSTALALYFIEHNQAHEAVMFGMEQTLNATVNLYDGLLLALK